MIYAALTIWTILSIGLPARAESPTTRPFAVWSDASGRLQLTRLTCSARGIGSESWGPTPVGWRYERTGTDWHRVMIETRGNDLEIYATHWPATNWTCPLFRLIQTPGETAVEVLIRTPPGMPDWRFTAKRRHTAELATDPVILGLLNESLAELGQPPYDSGEYLRTIRESRIVDGWIGAKVEDAIQLLGSRSPRLRSMGQSEIEDLGWPAAVYLRRRDLRDLTCEQRRAVLAILIDYPDAN